MKAQIVETLRDAPVGAVRLTGQLGGKHPADGLLALVSLGGGALMNVINPKSFQDGGLGWRLRYGNLTGVRYAAASVVDDYDYLCSPEITQAEAYRRLRVLRAARTALSREASHG